MCYYVVNFFNFCKWSLSTYYRFKKKYFLNVNENKKLIETY